MSEILCDPKIRFVALSDATKQGCRNRIGAQNKAAFSCNLTVRDAESAGNFSFFHGCFMPSCVNFIVMNVSRFSADNGPGRGVATASLKACRELAARRSTQKTDRNAPTAPGNL